MISRRAVEMANRRQQGEGVVRLGRRRRLAHGGDGIPRGIRAAANASGARRAAQSPQGRHVIARKSGHYIPLTEPELIAEEIRRIIQPTDGENAS